MIQLICCCKADHGMPSFHLLTLITSLYMEQVSKEEGLVHQ